MPELPEVESFRKYIADTSLHQKIEIVRTAARGMLIETTDADLKRVLKTIHLKTPFVMENMLHFGMM